MSQASALDLTAIGGSASSPEASLVIAELEEEPAEETEEPEETVIYGIDDSALMRGMLGTLATTVLGCRADRCAMLGATMAGVESFVDVALG